MKTCTRLISFDYGHRLLNHEAKCANVHGHRGVVEITVGAESLDIAGRVIDFGVIKQIVGGWIDDKLDHAFIANPVDHAMVEFLIANKQSYFLMPSDLAEPSAENIVQLIMGVAIELLKPHDVLVTHVRFYETPNNWTDAERPSTFRLPPSDLQRYA